MILQRGVFVIFAGKAKKRILHSRTHRNRSPLQSQSCWSAESRRPGCRCGRSPQRSHRSPPCPGWSPGFCWPEVKWESTSWGSPERRRPPRHPSADTPPSLLGHRCCCHGEDNPRHGEVEPQKNSECAAMDHWLFQKVIWKTLLGAPKWVS